MERLRRVRTFLRQPMYIYNAQLLTMCRENPFTIPNGYVKIENGVITEVSEGFPFLLSDMQAGTTDCEALRCAHSSDSEDRH